MELKLAMRAAAIAPIRPKPESAKLVWWKRPEALAAAILLAVIALNIFFY